MIAISGGPNTNSEVESELLHHTIGLVDYSYQREMFTRVTAEAIIIRHAREAPAQIDARDRHGAAPAASRSILRSRAISRARRRRHPVHGASAAHPQSRRGSLVAAVDHAAEVLNAAVKPVLVAGVNLRNSGAEAAFANLADAWAMRSRAMPNAEELRSPRRTRAITGMIWGPVSSPGCGEIIESADIVLYAGPTFTDYTDGRDTPTCSTPTR